MNCGELLFTIHKEIWHKNYQSEDWVELSDSQQIQWEELAINFITKLAQTGDIHLTTNFITKLAQTGDIQL